MDTSRRNPLQAQTLGDAHFATPVEVSAAGLIGDKGIRLGYYKAPEDRGENWGQVIRYGGDAHLITVAPTRSGKGRDVLIPALLEYPGSCIVIDPKGQLAAVTRAHRERPKTEGGLGQEVIVLNPFNLLSDELGSTARYNPMQALDPAADSFGADCDSLAEAIVIRDGRGESHWPDSARQLVSGMIMHLVANEPPELQNLAAVQKLVSGSLKDLRDFVRDAMDADTSNGGGFIKARLARFENINDETREALGIISTAITQTGFIGNAAIARSLSGSDFRFRDLKQKATTVYLVLPAKQIETCGKWFRLVVASALADLWSETRGAVPVLAILDEFAQLGHLQAIENAMGLAAGFGLQLWPILQNLAQLKKNYGDNWETFLGGAAIQQFFGPRDDFTAEYISKLCGVKTVVTHGQSVQHAEEILQKDRTGASWGQQSQPLLHPHNVRNLGPNECLIVGPQNIVIDAFRKPYRHIDEFEGLYSPDPYHKSDAPDSGGAGPANSPPPIDSFAAREATSAHAVKESLTQKRPLPIRLLMWGSSANPTINALRKAEYVLTLPLRVVAALLAAPFAIHNRPLGALLGFLALFGFWEVWNSFAKEPLLQVYQLDEQTCTQRRLIADDSLMGHTMACKVEGLKNAARFFWRHGAVAVVKDGPAKAAADFDVAFGKEVKQRNDALHDYSSHVAAKITGQYDPVKPRTARQRLFGDKVAVNAGAKVYFIQLAPSQIPEVEDNTSPYRTMFGLNPRSIEQLPPDETVQYILNSEKEPAFIRVDIFSDHGALESTRLIKRSDGRIGLAQVTTRLHPPNENPPRRPPWTDPDTKLVWAGIDNGFEIPWDDGNDYCRSLDGGNSGWRLPTIDEVVGLRDPAASPDHIKGITLTSCCVWINARNADFNFLGMHRTVYSSGVAERRALCVHN